MFLTLGCISKPIGPSQLAPPASLSRHVRRPSHCWARHWLCSFSLGDSRAVSLTQLNVPSHKHELKPPPVVINRFAVLCNVADLALSSSRTAWEGHRAWMDMAATGTAWCWLCGLRANTQVTCGSLGKEGEIRGGEN